jgi:nitrogen fixation NifU-like protein
MYSEKVMEHFMHPRNVGEIEDADGIGEVGNPVCGDIKVENNRLKDVKFKTFGCGAAIAVSSMVSEMAKGKTIDEAMNITNKMVAEKLSGLPPNKMHCSNLGADALHKAIENYLEKKKSTDNIKSTYRCPYCEEPIEGNLCKPCQVKFINCKNCGQMMSEKLDKCPKCGAENPIKHDT